MPTVSDQATRRQRWRELMAGDRRFVYTIGVPDESLPPGPPVWPDKLPERTEFAWRVYESQCERASWLEDDLLPVLAPGTGTEIFAEAFGCRVARPEDQMPFALPLIHDAGEVDALAVPPIDAPPLGGIFRMADELFARSGRQGLMKLPDIQSPMDIAALIWEKGALYEAMLEEPAAVHALRHKTEALLTSFLDEWFARYGHCYIAHHPYYYMEGGMTLSEDEVGAVSAPMFEEFFAPSLRWLSEHFGGIGIHCCADSRHQWDNFRQLPGLRLLNLNQPAEVIREAYDFFGADVVHLHRGWWPEGSVTDWPQAFPHACRVIWHVPADSRDDARKLADQLAAATGRT